MKNKGLVRILGLVVWFILATIAISLIGNPGIFLGVFLMILGWDINAWCQRR